MTIFLVSLGLFGIFAVLSIIGHLWRMATALEAAARYAQRQVQLSEDVNAMQAEILRLNHIMTAASQHGMSQPGKN